MNTLIDMEVKIEGETTLYANRYNKYAVTESPSNQGGKELTVYWIEHEPVELFPNRLRRSRRTSTNNDRVRGPRTSRRRSDMSDFWQIAPQPPSSAGSKTRHGAEKPATGRVEAQSVPIQSKEPQCD